MERSMNKKEKTHFKYLRNKEYYRQYEKERYASDFEYREKRRSDCRELIRRYRMMAISYLGGVCVGCGFSDIRALQIDHVAGNGAKERREIGNGSRFLKKVIKSSGEYQVLCANCNLIKKTTNGECQKHK
jgi:hypothetical protein